MKYCIAAVCLFMSSICSAEFVASRDLISLHYDFAPDPDDGHSAAAARSLMSIFEINALVVSGAVGINRNRYISTAPQLMDRIFGVGNYLDAFDNWETSVQIAALQWADVIESGGYVFVAEGGQSDFTADVIRKMQEMGVNRLTRNSVTVVQHSVWNENNTTQRDLQFVEDNATYVKIDDGNHVNATADLNQQSPEFLAWADAGVLSGVWLAALEFLPPSRKLDFSDTVELLHILGIGKELVSDPGSFSRLIEAGGSEVEAPISSVDSSQAVEGAIVVEAENFVSADEGWTEVSTRAGTSGGVAVKLLPDTRVTHSDPLINGENFWPNPGVGPELTYEVAIPVAGRYRVSVRAFSTGTEDNSIHVGVNGEYPESGARMQWCTGKGAWTWSSAQRTTDNHCGVNGMISINIPTPGVNTINFSAREDGFEFDSFRLELLNDNGSVLTNEQIAELTSVDNIVAITGKLQQRADARMAAIDECGHLEGNGRDNCIDAAVDHMAGQSPSNQQTVCSANASTLSRAKAQFASQCPMPVRDCDPNANGTWTCSSFQIGRGAPERYRVASEAWYAANSTPPVVEQPVISPPQNNNPIVETPDEPIEELPADDVVEENTPETPSSDAFNAPRTWSDSYSLNGQCFCASNFDHGIGDKTINTPDGVKTMREVCGRIQALYGGGGSGERVYYNTIQCGHGPTNDFFDELQCPGYPENELNYSGPNCRTTGPNFNVAKLYEPEVIGEVPEDSLTTGWWKPKASDNLTWYMQFNGSLNTNIDADVFFIDVDVNKSVVDSLKARGKRVMCYISAGSSENWRSDNSSIPEAVKGNIYSGWPGERWLDTTNIEIIGPIMRARMDTCKEKGFDGIDADNVNGHVNPTGFNITRDEAITYIRWLVNESHKRGMAFSLKNAEDLASQVVDDVDMLQSESCFVYSNCTAARVISSANKPVWMVEYDSVTRNWDAACENAKQNGFSAILRDVLLTANGVYRQCL